MLAAIFLLAASGLAYEVTLTRLFSLIFQYHYVFLIVSLAIAGLSLGAAIAAFSMRRSPAGAPVGDTELVNAAVLLALLFVVAAVVLAQLRYADRIAVAVIAGLLPFVGIGYLNAALFARYAEASGILYAADLLGGAVGLGAALVVISLLGAFNGILALAALACLCALIFARMAESRPMQIRAAGVAVALVAALIVNLAVDGLDYAPRRLKEAPPDKTMLTVLKDESADVTETRWGPFARLDVVETSDEAIRYVFTDAGAGSIMVGYSGEDSRVAWLRSEIAYLPFVAASEPPDKVLILGAGAGKDVLMAHLAGAGSITAVEINPQLVDLTRDLGGYNGDVYDLPGVETVIADGRTYAERSDAQYDLIYANLVYSQAAAPGHSALAESYIFTREALQTYWDRLSESGRIGFVTHHGIEGLRLLVAALDMLEDEGMTLAQALEHVALISLTSGDAQTRTSVVMILRQPWTSEAAAAFADEVHARSGGALYLPSYQEMGLEGLSLGAMSLDQFIDENADEFNFTPTTDDRPFFYQFAPGLPDQLSDLLLISLILVGVYLSWNMFFFLRRGEHWKRVSLAPYFALLGVAFMLVEIPLIQRFGLLLGQPVLALVVVIGALLVGGGLGSLFESRYPVRRLPRLIGAAAVIVGLAVLAARVTVPALIEWALPSSLAVRVLVTIAAPAAARLRDGDAVPRRAARRPPCRSAGRRGVLGRERDRLGAGLGAGDGAGDQRRVFGGAAARRGAVCAGGDGVLRDLAAAGGVINLTPRPPLHARRGGVGAAAVSLSLAWPGRGQGEGRYPAQFVKDHQYAPTKNVSRTLMEWSNKE